MYNEDYDSNSTTSKEKKVVKKSFVSEVPAKPIEVTKPSYDKDAPISMINRYVKNKLRLVLFVSWFLIGSFQILLCFLIVYNFNLENASSVTIQLYFPQLIFTVAVVLTELIIGLLLIRKHKVKVKKWDVEKFCDTRFITIFKVLNWILFVLFAFACGFLSAQIYYSDHTNWVYITLLIWCALCAVSFVLMTEYCIFIEELAKRIRVELYEKNRINSRTPVIVLSFEELNKDNVAYEDYQKELKQYKHLLKCYENNKPINKFYLKLINAKKDYIKVLVAVLLIVVLYAASLILTIISR